LIVGDGRFELGTAALGALSGGGEVVAVGGGVVVVVGGSVVVGTVVVGAGVSDDCVAVVELSADLSLDDASFVVDCESDGCVAVVELSADEPVDVSLDALAAASVDASVDVSAHATANGVAITVSTTVNSSACIVTRVRRLWCVRRRVTRERGLPLVTLPMNFPCFPGFGAIAEVRCSTIREGRSHQSLTPGASQVTERSWRSSHSCPATLRNDHGA
jgi:hypothetical protein